MKSESKFTEKIEKKVAETISKYQLINKKDKVLVAVSGGKDSTALLHILKKLNYNVEAVTVDVVIGKYTKDNLERIKQFCKKNSIKLHTISFRKVFGTSLCYIISALKSKGENLNSCTVCGVVRRSLLNKKARQLKATKIATGHNMDDECQNILMNYLRNNIRASARLGPITGLTKDKKFIPRIKPLYFIEEHEVEKYSKTIGFDVDYGKCPCCVDAYRNAVRTLLDKYKKKNPEVCKNTVSHFLKLLPKLKKQFATTRKINCCTQCGEPCKDDICRVCDILGKLKQ